MYFLCVSHSTTLFISHIDYYCMKICMPIMWRNTPSSQPLSLSYPQQCCYSSVSWSYFKINYIHFKKFQNHKKQKIQEALRDVCPKFSQSGEIGTRGKNLCCVMYSLFLNQASYSSSWQEWTHLNYDKFQIDSNEGWWLQLVFSTSNLGSRSKCT